MGSFIRPLILVRNCYPASVFEFCAQLLSHNVCEYEKAFPLCGTLEEDSCPSPDESRPMNGVKSIPSQKQRQC